MRASIGGLGQPIGTMVAGMQERWGVPLAELPNQKPNIETAKKLLAEAGHPERDRSDAHHHHRLRLDGPGGGDAARAAREGKYPPEHPARRSRRLDQELPVEADGLHVQRLGDAARPEPPVLPPLPQGAGGRRLPQLEERRRQQAPGRRAGRGDPAQAQGDLPRFQKDLAETVPTIMLFCADHVTVRGEKVRNYVQHPTGWYLRPGATYLAQ